MISAVPLSLILIAIIAYLLGSLSFALIVSRCMHLQDPRAYGSGNPGATNVLRSGNKYAALLTLLGDMGKGSAAVGLAALWLKHVLGYSAALAATHPGLALAGVAVFMGHVFPVFLHFKGGKGVATALGVLLALQPLLAALTAAIWVVTAWLTRYSSLAAIMAALTALAGYSLMSSLSDDFDPYRCAAIALMTSVLIWRHRSNLVKLSRGEETKIGQPRRQIDSNGDAP